MPKPGAIAVLNAGSSSIKFALYDADATDLLFGGQIEGLGASPHLKVRDADGKTVAEKHWPDTSLDHRAATAEIMMLGRELLAFGGRVGGSVRVHRGKELRGRIGRARGAEQTGERVVLGRRPAGDGCGDGRFHR